LLGKNRSRCFLEKHAKLCFTLVVLNMKNFHTFPYLRARHGKDRAVAWQEQI
jgi:hypothetical protein